MSRTSHLAAVLALLVAAPAALHAGAALTPESEANGSAATATLLASPGIGAGNVYPNGDVDYWKFSAAAGARVYAAVVTSLSSSLVTNSKLTLLAADGTTVLESDEDNGTLGTLASAIAGRAVGGAGTYYLRVEYSGTSQLRPYRLYLQTRSGAPTAETEPNDEPAQALPAGGWVSGTIDPGDTDDFTLDLAAGDTVYLSLDLDPERNGDFGGELAFGPFAGSMLLADDDGAGTPDSESLVVAVREAGTYTISVDASSAENGTYHLSATVLPEANEGASCATYSSAVVKVIPTAGQVTSTIVVPGNPRIADLDVSIELTHADPGDLDVHLRSPAGNDNGLFTDVGGADHPAIDVRLDDEAPFPIGTFPVAEGLVVAPENAVSGNANPTSDSFRLSWFDGEDAGGTWTLVLDDDLAGDGGSLTGWSLRVCQAAAAPACPGGTDPVTLLDESFEGGDDGGFTHTGVADEWQLGKPTRAPISTCASGIGCWKTDLDGTYDASSDQSLYSPSIDLGAAGLLGPVVVRWSQRYQIEDAKFDQYAVTLQETGGGSPSTLFQWLDGDMEFTAGVAATTVEGSAGWGVVARTIPSSYLGGPVELRFRLESDTTVHKAGVAIDDVVVTACQSGGSTDLLFSDGFESSDACAWSVREGAPACP